MAIEKKSNFSLEEISKQLGVTPLALKSFLELKNHETYVNSNRTEQPLALFIIDEFLINLKELVQINKRSSETWTTYNNFLIRVKSYLHEHCSSLKITELNEIILLKIIQSSPKKKDKYAVKTLNKYSAIMKSIMTFAFEMNYTQVDFGYKFKFENAALLPRYIKDEDVSKILKCVESFSKPYRCRAMIIFLLGTGCRVSEISSMRVKDFDVENDLIFIRKGKGNKERYIPMFKEVKEEILHYLSKSGMEEWDSKYEGYLFARDENLQRERKFPIRTIEYLADRLRERLPEINHITVHTFRHTFAVKCLKMGISLHNLSLILGHSDPKTTMVYTQLYNEDLKEQITNKFPFPFENLLNQVIKDEDVDK
ncbi:tyrosine-type recombinase/integrase [Lysinibacillus sp. NPDC097287]|uniref:tyrosine-type recombinase/integrase n=1 Tax=Lysinibacillus sp. NPDC097287 TaxID=3364144 RepID=UPI0037FA1842